MQTIILRRSLIVTLLSILLSVSSCKKFVHTDGPTTEVNSENVYTNDATAISVLTGIYSQIAQGIPGPNISTGPESFSLSCGLSADEYFLFSGGSTQMMGFYRNALLAKANLSIGTSYWDVIYELMYSVNSAIEGLSKSNGLTETIKLQLMGEAKFLRAFLYFYLVNLYGEVPLVISTDFKINSALQRAAVADVYRQIIGDLKDAKQVLSENYLDGKLANYLNSTTERVRPNKHVATALLARCYLYTNDWSNAEIESTKLISNKELYDTVPLNTAFLKASMGNKEAIWQLQVVKSDQNTDDSKIFIINTGFTSSNPVCLSDTLVSSFEIGDKRKEIGNWVNSIDLQNETYYYPFKYKNNSATLTEYIMVFRIAEQYLIRAEARAQQNKVSESQQDLNIIRQRAGLPNTGSSDKTSLLKSILHERQIELFSEWGHRWFDLKRTNNIDEVMTVITPRKANGSPWQPFQKWYPISIGDLQRAPNVIQTEGY